MFLEFDLVEESAVGSNEYKSDVRIFVNINAIRVIEPVPTKKGVGSRIWYEQTNGCYRDLLVLQTCEQIGRVLEHSELALRLNDDEENSP